MNYLPLDVALNQAIQMQDVSHIIVITDAIHAVKKIFDPSMHLHQQQMIMTSKELRAFLLGAVYT